jgi:hypothetical protein
MLGILFLVLLISFALGINAKGASWIASARRSLAWAALGGMLGFVLGFAGPMLIAPTAAQGPLYGVFLTGPAGFVGGLIFGVARELLARMRNPERQ